METRGRGRAARSERVPSGVQTRAQAAAARESVEPVLTRSQASVASAPTNPVASNSRLASVSPIHRSRSSASTTTPAAGPAHFTRSSVLVSPSGTPSQHPVEVSSESRTSGPRTRRRASRPQVSEPQALRQSGRKRTRSSRKPPQLPALPSQAQANAGEPSSVQRPSKRPRRGAVGSRGGPSTHPQRPSRPRMDSSSPPDSINGSTNNDGRPDDEGPSSFRSGDRTGAATLQGLLRSLGAGLDDVFPITQGSSQGRLRQLLAALRSSEDSTQHLDALSQLCDYLSVGTEESLVSFSIDSFVPPLVNMLSNGTPDTKLLSARALTHMMDALPASAASVAHHGAAGPLCANLLSIQYIDLAEQSLAALEKLSTDFPQPIVRAGGFSAALSFIDFFSTGVQRVAAAIVCNLCRSPPSDTMDMIVTVLPAMRGLLDSEDQRIREYTIQGFSRLADAFRGSSAKLERLCSENAVLVDKVLDLVVPSSPPALAPSLYASALHLLATLARGSVMLSSKLLKTGPLILKLKHHLESGGSPYAVDSLTLTDALLPEPTDPDDTLAVSSRSRRRRNSTGVATSLAAVDRARREELEKEPKPLEQVGNALFVPLMRFYVACADTSSRQLTLSVLCKFVAIVPDDVLSSSILPPTDPHHVSVAEVSFCPFVSTLLGENSSNTEVQAGLCLANSALRKVPGVKGEFVREGVAHELLRLAKLATMEIEEGDSNTATREVLRSSGGVSRAESSSDRALRSSSLRHAAAEARDRRLRSQASPATRLPSPNDGNTGNAPTSRGDDESAAPRLAIRVGSVRSMTPESNLAVVAKRAVKIVRIYFPGGKVGAESEAIKGSVLKQLTEIHDDLLKLSKENSQSGVARLEDFVNKIIADSGISVFEFSRSRIAEALLEFLSCENLPSAFRTERCAAFVSALNKRPDQKPFRLLVNRTLGSFSAEEKLPLQVNEISSSSSSAVGSGLRQLAQPFKLRLRRSSSSSGSELKDYSHHIVLIEPLATMSSVQDFLWPRVQASSGGGNRSRKSHECRQSRVVGGDTGSDAEFIEPEHVDEADADIHDDDNTSSQNSYADGDNDNGDQELDVEGQRSEDQFPAESIFEIDEHSVDRLERLEDENDVDHGHNIENSDEEVSSASDDVIGQGDVDGEELDHDGSGSFGLDQVSGSLPAFELDHDALAQGPRTPTRASNVFEQSRGTRQRSPSNAGASSNDARSANLRSYAAALTGVARRGHRAGEVSRNQSNISGRRAPKLSFSLNGVSIPHDSSILSAVIRASGSSSLLTSRLWSEVHTLTYDRASPQSSGRQVGGNREDTSRNSGNVSAGPGNAQPRRSSRLRNANHIGQTSDPGGTNQASESINVDVSQKIIGRILMGNIAESFPKIPRFSSIQGVTAKYISFLIYLKWIYDRSDPLTVADSNSSFLTSERDSNIDFASQKMTAKIKRQVSDPLAICGGAIPTWCYAIAREAPFLIPFDTRRVLFQSTALGVARALHLLQSRDDSVASSGGQANAQHRSMRSLRESETRISRIQRQKVRIHRSRILESAARVMTMYGSHSTVLEVEYFDEVGTGLGPTLEFYTLASREVQRADLHLWRSQSTFPHEGQLSLNSVVEIPESRTRSRVSRAAGSRQNQKRTTRGTPTTTKKSLTLEESNADPDCAKEYIMPTGEGLFPAPLVQSKKLTPVILEHFAFVGRLVAKALADGRLLDLRFSQTFCELLLEYVSVLTDCGGLAPDGDIDGPFHAIGAGDGALLSQNLKLINHEKVWERYCAGFSQMKMLSAVDPQLASSLQKLIDMMTNGQGNEIENLCLSFTLPGDDSIELVPRGRDRDVVAKNVEEYIARVSYCVLFDGIRRQAESFLLGFSEVLDIRSLSLFQPHELEMLICGPAHEEWTIEFLVQATRCDHGFRHESEAVLILFRVLSELSIADQRRFVLFVTGSPALPLGGLRNLNPRLTIVKRTPEGGRSPDECLPTVMTCTNYLKLPDYSDYNIAKDRILYAIQEGQGSFHLS